MDDYPNSGESFDEFATPIDQDREAREEKSKVESSYPILNELIETLEDAIANTDSIEAMGITSAMPQIQVQIIMEGSRKFKALMETELEKIKNLKDVHMPDSK